jgi:hypothetical protein
MPNPFDSGAWRIVHQRWTAPFEILFLDLAAKSGSVFLGGRSVPLTNLTLSPPDKISASFSLDGKIESFEAKFDTNYTGLTFEFSRGKGFPVRAMPIGGDKYKALRLIETFRRKTDRGAFPKISRQAVADGLVTRILAPETIDQAFSSFCGPAAFMYCFATKDAAAYAKFVTDLYDFGRATLGHLSIEPSSSFRFDTLPWDSTAVDWIALGSLRDSENWFFEYHRNEVPFFNAAGGAIFNFTVAGHSLANTFEEIRGGTTASEMVKWLENVGYSRVEDWTGAATRDSSMRLANEYLAKNHRVCLQISANMLLDASKGSAMADHFVVLTAPIRFEGDFVSFQIFTWHSKQTYRLRAEDFRKNYYGFVAAGR